ncbi:hypothetical protein [Pelosinus sp. IPA-1]|uniref:hypothetical protein n=1 Tax=Pelosinus sp. IPA-1 TaxID=3029569 RepID=UPI002554B776|nr:hypothetical protein [Pelosinus sp. IPA-1]
MVTNEQLLQTSKYLNNIILSKWLSDQFLSPLWIGFVLAVLFSYAIFFYFADKKRIVELLLFGSLVAVAFSVYSSVGQLFGFWATLFRLVPLQQNFFMSDLTILPLSAMLLYQYSNSWKSFVVATVIWAGLFAFGFNSILVRLNAFIYLTPFGPYIDFVFLIIIGTIARGLLITLLSLQFKQGNMASKTSLSSLIAEPVLKPTNDSDNDNAP